jgi:hypothetical protein
MRRLLLILLGAAAIAACGGETPAPQAIGEPIAFSVCVDDHTWHRPPRAEHEALLAQDPRYPVTASLLAYYGAHFFRDMGGAAEDIKYAWAGLRNASYSYQTQGPCSDAYPRDQPNKVALGQEVELWILGYGVEAVLRTAEGVTVQVTPRESGYQVVQFPNPMEEDAWHRLDIVLVGATQEPLGHIGLEEVQLQLGRASEDGEIPLSVCTRSEQWDRPTEEEQRSRLVAEGEPYASMVRRGELFAPGRVFVDSPEASQIEDILNRTGLWTAELLPLPRICEADIGDLPLPAPERRLRVWVLSYDVGKVSFLDGRLSLQVEPMEHGYTVVQFTNPRETGVPPISLQLTNGTEVDSLPGSD